MTFVELLVALAIAGIFLVSILFTFTQILRTSDESEAQVMANDQARAALLYITQDLAAVRRDSTTPVQEFLLVDGALSYGDGKDNDGDGLVDEELFDGLDNDGDWTLAQDRHAQIGTEYERPDFQGFPDLGDAAIDRDFRFGSDRLVLRIPPDPLGLDTRDERITYELGTYNGEDHVLLRTVVSYPGSPTERTITEPLAFNVLGFDVLAWNSNADSVDASGRNLPYWTSSWDASVNVFPFNKPFGAPDGVSPFEYPTSVLVAVTLYSGRFPFESLDWTPGEPIDALTLTTTLDLEIILKDLRYQVYIR
jgi:type II secretory pathway pseudopilin PulG